MIGYPATIYGNIGNGGGMEGGRLLTVGDVAERLRVHPDTVRRWLRSGKLRGARLGSDRAGWRVREAEVERLLEPTNGTTGDDAAGVG